MRGQIRYDALDGLLAFGALVLPFVSGATFATWMIVWEQPLDGPHFLLGLLACIAAGEVTSSESQAAFVRLHGAQQLLVGITWRWAVFALIAWAAIELAGLAPNLDRNVMLSAGLSTPLVLWLAQLAIARAMVGRNVADGPVKGVVVGLTEIASRWEASLLRESGLRVEIVGFFDDREQNRRRLPHRARMLGKMSEVVSFVNRHGIGVVYVTLPMSRQPRIVELIESLRDSTASIYFVPDVYAFDPVQARIECVHGIPLVAICESPFRGAAALGKRAVDVVVSLAAIALFSLPMLFIGLLVRLSSPGPAIFRQTRYGLDGRNITVLKFRTLSVTEDGATTYTQVSRGDSRVTALGAFLRATSLDELPQLFNVLWGTMSIVGPRPHAVAVNEQYRQLIPRYMLRHKVKPGITGLAQIRGYRGGDDLVSMTKRIECDIKYLRDWSLGLDLKIMARTALLLWGDRNAF